MILPDWLPMVLCLCAALLTAGFRRHRLFQFSVLLCLMAGGLSVPSELRGQQAVLAFVPWLLAWAAVMPEARWRARRSVIWLVALALLLVLSLYAPEHVVRTLVRAGLLVYPESRAGLGALLLLWLAAAVLLVRWVMRAGFFDAAAAFLLLVLGVCFLRSGDPSAFAFWLVLSAGSTITLVLVGSYRMAFVDGLTGLPNRRALDETLDRLSGTYAIAMVDVDHFKQFNDNHGHAAGDVVLREVGAILGEHSGGRAFRYGGEEFCLVYLDARSEQALDGCEAARAALESRSIRVRSPNAQGKPGKPKEVRVTASLGLANRTEKRKLAREVLQAADKALYKAKGQGRNRVVSA
ncbi:MAG: GGDEF domain-containing protein [Ahniella sp.]|nr:GGDEF domain-containing protein [Ahniella sp.]